MHVATYAAHVQESSLNKVNSEDRNMSEHQSTNKRVGVEFYDRKLLKEYAVRTLDTSSSHRTRP